MRFLLNLSIAVNSGMALICAIFFFAAVSEDLRIEALVFFIATAFYSFLLQDVLYIKQEMSERKDK